MIHLIFKENLSIFKEQIQGGGRRGEARLEAGESMRQVKQQQRLGMMAFRSTRVMVETKSKEPRCILEA